MRTPKLVQILIVFSILSLICCQPQPEEHHAFFEDKLVLESNSIVAAYAIPNIVTTPYGTVLCFATARIGDNHDWGNIQKVVVARSTDNGETWEAPEVIAAIENWTVRQTSAIVDTESGKVMVFGHKSPRFNDEGERISESWKTFNPDKMKKLGEGHFFIESLDDGKTWSEMKAINLPYWPHDPGIVLQSKEYKGRFVLPARITKGKKFDWNNMFNGVLISDDKGKTWREGGLTQSHVGEACVVELSDGRVYVNSRNHADNYGIRNHAISSDGGETFTEFGDDPQLIEPTCDAGMVSFEDQEKGHVILFSNPAVKATKRWDGASRRRMSVKASFDDGKTWPINKLVNEGSSAYSGIAVGNNNMIFLAYEHAALGSKDSRQNIAIARFNMAWLEQEEVIPPVIEPKNIVFYENQKVEIRSAENLEIHFTTDGTIPDINSPAYQEPLIIDTNTTLKAIAYSGNIGSIVSSSVFNRSLQMAPDYRTKYSDKYSASGEYGLVDGIHGSLNYYDGCWQGFEGVDLNVVVDLTTVQPIQHISVGFLQATDFWVFYPEFVTIEISIDGKEFIEAATIQNEIPLTEAEPARQILEAKLTDCKAQYIKVRAGNIGVCPDWHKGVEGKAWLFTDEIIIK